MSLVDFEQVKIHFGNDRDLIVQLVQIFRETYPEVLKDLMVSLENKSSKDIELHAHTLKGMVANLFCERVAEKSFELEVRGRKDKLQGDEIAIVNEVKNLIQKMLVEYEERFKDGL